MENKGVLKVSSLIIGSIVGAGFITGKEVIEFFSLYGKYGLYGAAFICFLFFLLISSILIYSKKNNIDNFPDFISSITSKKERVLIDVVIYSFCFAVYCVMLSASGALFSQFLSFTYFYGIFFISVACFLSFIYDIEGISTINSIIIPLLLIGTILICLLYTHKMSYKTTYNIQSSCSWLLSAVLYLGYNSILALIILPFSAKFISNTSSAFWTGILSSLSLFILLYLLISATSLSPLTIKNLEIPMLAISSLMGKPFKFFYIVLLQIAIYTTALSSGYACIFKISHNWSINKVFLSFLFCFASIPISLIKFSVLIKYLYTLFGIIGISIVLLFFINILRKNKKGSGYGKKIF